MNVLVYSEDGTLLWSRGNTDVSGLTAQSYLRDGTQEQIIAALLDALVEARGQLGRRTLKIVDAVPNIGLAAAEIDCHVPVAALRDSNSSR